MPFKKGQSGNPAGKPKQKEFTAALRLAMNETDKASGRKKLRVIAEKLVECAMEGQPWAIQQFADRIEGKAPQAPEDRNNDNDRANSEERIARLTELALKLGADRTPEDTGSGKPTESKVKLPGIHQVN